MLQVIFTFSDWILINQIIVFSTPFALGGNRFSKNSACSFEWITGAWVKMYRFDAFFRCVNSKYQLWTANIFPTYGGICKSEKIQQAFWREIKPSGVMEYKRMYLWGLSWRTSVVSKTVYNFAGSNLAVEIFFKKWEHYKKGALK